MFTQLAEPGQHVVCKNGHYVARVLKPIVGGNLIVEGDFKHLQEINSLRHNCTECGELVDFIYIQDHLE